MDQIILQTGFKYLIAGLSAEQKGRLFDLLLEHAGESDISAAAEKEDAAVGNIFRYIMLQQQESAAKRQRMRDIGAKGGAAKRQLALFAGKGGAFPSLTNASVPADDAQALPEQRQDKRKEAKENNKRDLKNNIFNFGKKVSARKDANAAEKQAFLQENGFIPPTVAEVRAFVESEALKVDAAVFVDFYTARGWRVGRTPIRSWQATARLWHHRAEEKVVQSGSADLSGQTQIDEDYWSEMETRVKNSEEKAFVKPVSAPPPAGHPLHRQDILMPVEKKSSNIRCTAVTADGEIMPLSPFASFMKRIEENDFTPAELAATLAGSDTGNRTAGDELTGVSATGIKSITGEKNE